MVKDVGGGTADDKLSEVEHVQAISDEPDQVEIVLDEQHGRVAFGGHLQEHATQGSRFGAVQPG